jgi:hypothetical protein
VKQSNHRTLPVVSQAASHCCRFRDEARNCTAADAERGVLLLQTESNETASLSADSRPSPGASSRYEQDPSSLAVVGILKAQSDALAVRSKEARTIPKIVKIRIELFRPLIRFTISLSVTLALLNEKVGIMSHSLTSEQLAHSVKAARSELLGAESGTGYQVEFGTFRYAAIGES